MTDNMIMMWKDIMSAMFTCIDEDFLDLVFDSEIQVVSPEAMVEHILLEFCKHSYHENIPKYSLRHFIDYGLLNNAERMTINRTMKYAQEFKDRNIAILENTNIDPNEYAGLRAKPMDTIKDRIDGYELSEMDFFEMRTIHDLELVKAISENRIFSSKKVSSYRFEDLFSNYDLWVQSLIDRSKKSDEDMVFSSIAFFTFEWKYSIEYFYQLSKYLIEQNIGSIDFYSTWLFTGTYDFESVLGFTVSTDSRMVKERIELIPLFFDSENSPLMTDYLRRRFIETLTIKSLMFELTSTEGGRYVDWFRNNTTVADLASFFRDYDVFQIWQRKTFDNKLIKTMRYVLKESSTFNKSA